MPKHFFTFGKGYPETVVVINTDSPERAKAIMFAAFGGEWGFQYTEEQWTQAIEEGHFKNAKYLPEVTIERR